mgnify:CR=1 FL=1
MPNPTTHLLLLYDQVLKPTDRYFIENFEYILLGAVSPDLRVITKSDRKDYHYFDLNSGIKGDGIKGFIKNTIDFSGLVKKNINTNNFIRGYFSHLIADENWTIDVFRKIFMNKSIFPDFSEALLSDRALQIYLDIKINRDNIDLYQYYDSKPMRILGSLMGHEGKGSLLSFLKDKGLATGLRGGGSPDTPDYGSAGVNIQLTEKGVSNYQEVLGYFFSYVAMLKKEGFKNYIFNIEIYKYGRFFKYN